jgi:ribosomal protein S6--L-glutamate ligase
MREVALGCGRAFGVGLYGVDLITSGGKPYVVDINTFPGFKGVPNAEELLAEHIMRSASGIGETDRGNLTSSND